MIRISLEGDGELIGRLLEMGDRGRALFKEALEDSTDHVKNRAVEGIANGPKTGRVYTQRFFTRGQGADRMLMAYGSRPPHQASARGEYPAADTGNLMRSIWAEVDDQLADLNLAGLDAQLSAGLAGFSVAESEINGTVGAHAAYAVHLEYKAPTDGGRPFLRRALFESTDWIEQRFLSLRGRIVNP